MGAYMKERPLCHAVSKEDRPILYLLPVCGEDRRGVDGLPVLRRRPSDHHCRRFRYDPLRRIPGRPAVKKS